MLKHTIEGLHSCSAAFHATEHVQEHFQGQAIWGRDIHIFNLEGHKKASVCYAWDEPIPNSDRRKIYTVLQIDPVKSAKDAVRATIVKEYREARK